MSKDKTKKSCDSGGPGHVAPARATHAHVHAHEEKSELPLILFTLCAAASVGFVAVALVAFAADLIVQGGFEPSGSAGLAVVLLQAGPLALQTSLVQPALALGAFALASVGMLASIAHLAKPLRAPRALTNLASSWLSREILAVSAYWAGCLAWFGSCFVSAPAAFALCVVSLALGILVLISAAKAYQIHGQPLWHGPETCVELFAAAGGAGVPLASLIAFAALSYSPMPLALGPELSFSPYLVNDALFVFLVLGLAAALVLYWLTGRMRARRLAAIVDPTPRERLAMQRLVELEGPREFVLGLCALALLAGVLAALAWFVAGCACLGVLALSAAIGCAAFFTARARFYRMSVISRHALRRNLR